MKKALIICLVLIVTLPAVFALFQPGFFPSHDGEWMVIRLSAFHQALRDGQFPGSFTQAIKLVFIGSFFASALTMFYWLRQKFSFWPALVGSLVYIYTPYRFVDTYVRGSIGESLGFVFVPLVFYALDLIPKKPKTGIILGAFAIAATILSHNVFIIFVILAAIYGILSLPHHHLKHLILSLALGVALSAYFWLPALTELKYVYASKLTVANPVDHLVSFRQLLLPAWGYGPSSPVDPASMSFQVGLVNLGIILISLVFFRRYLFLVTGLVAAKKNKADRSEEHT